MLVKLTQTLNGYRANLVSRLDASGLTYDWDQIPTASSSLGAKLHWNHWMQLEQANWQLGEVLVRESWSIFLEICQTQLGKAWTFIEFSGGPGFVWAGSFNSAGQGTLRFFAIDPSALLPMVSKERTEVVPPADPQNDCYGLAANPSDRGKPPSVPGVPYDSLLNQAEQAIEVCTLAAQQNPTELRYEYQLARAMEAEVPEKAVEIQKKLAS